jgi:hypothetical protein
MVNLALTFLPDEFLPLVIAIIGVGVVLGFRQLMGWIPSILLSVLLTPVITSFLGGLPPVFGILLFVGFVLWAVRAFLNLVLGRGAADHLVGALAADAVRGLFLLVFGLPVLILRALAGAGGPRPRHPGGPR